MPIVIYLKYKNWYLLKLYRSYFSGHLKNQKRNIIFWWVEIRCGTLLSCIKTRTRRHTMNTSRVGYADMDHCTVRHSWWHGTYRTKWYNTHLYFNPSLNLMKRDIRLGSIYGGKEGSRGVFICQWYSWYPLCLSFLRNPTNSGHNRMASHYNSSPMQSRQYKLKESNLCHPTWLNYL